MFRPSRPMMRPFISSLGRLIELVVMSDTWSAAYRSMAVVMTSRALLSAPSRASSWIFRMSCSASPCSSFSIRFISRSAACSRVSSATSCSLASAAAMAPFSSSSRSSSACRSSSISARCASTAASL